MDGVSDPLAGVTEEQVAVVVSYLGSVEFMNASQAFRQLLGIDTACTGGISPALDHRRRSEAAADCLVALERGHVGSLGAREHRHDAALRPVPDAAGRQSHLQSRLFRERDTERVEASRGGNAEVKARAERLG